MIFSSAGPGFTTTAAARVDDEFLKAGIEKHPGKDENDSLSTLCVGVQLVNGTAWWPPAVKMWSLLLAATHLCSTRRGSSAGVLGFLGLLQWFDCRGESSRSIRPFTASPRIGLIGRSVTCPTMR
jgi:hypothetical protein